MTARPPGFTCPAIDRAQRTARRVAWRVRRIAHVPDGERAIDHHAEAVRLLRQLATELEIVREENRAMRAAYHAMRERLRAAGID